MICTHRASQTAASHGAAGPTYPMILVALAVIALARAILYVAVTPMWQGPDEPAHFEYARLLTDLRRVPQRGEDTTALQREIIASLARHRFWVLVGQPRPDPLPQTFREDPWLRNAGRQVGAETPLYYMLPAALLSVSDHLEVQVWLARLSSALLYPVLVVAAGVAGRQLFERERLLHLGLPIAVAFAPMPTFMSAVVNNDALANALSACFFALAIRSWCGQRSRVASVTMWLVWLLSLATKRTNWFLFPVGIAALAAPIWRWARERQVRWRSLMAATVIIGVPTLVALLQPTPYPAGWHLAQGRSARASWLAEAHSGHKALLLSDVAVSERAVARQVIRLPAHAGRLVLLRLWWRARAIPSRACVTLDDGVSITQSCHMPAETWEPYEVVHRLSPGAEYLRVAIGIGAREEFEATGVVAVDDVTLRAESGWIQLRNGGFETAARRIDRLLILLEDLLNLTVPIKASWLSASSYTPALWGRYGWYVALAFVHFWGAFGWLQRPFPIGVYILLAGLAVLSFIGLAGRRSRWKQWVDRSVVTWMAGASLSALCFTFLPMIGQLWQPQGRYLFPALVPLFSLWLIGLRSWLPVRLSPAWQRCLLIAWILWWWALDQTAIWRILYQMSQISSQ